MSAALRSPESTHDDFRLELVPALKSEPVSPTIVMTQLADGSLLTQPFDLWPAQQPQELAVDVSGLPGEQPDLALPASQNEFAPYPTENNTAVFEFRPERPRRVRKYVIGTLAGLALFAHAAYDADVDAGKYASSKARPAMSAVAFAHDPETVYSDASQVIVGDFPGLSGRDAQNYAPQEWAVGEHGTLMAMKYGQNVDAEPLAALQIKTAEAAGVTEVAELGHSEGSINAINTAAALYKSSSNIQVPYIVLDCPPFDIDSVRSNKLGLADYITWVLSHANDIENSGIANALAQGAVQWLHDPLGPLKQGVIANIGAAFKEYDSVNSPQKASISLIDVQYNAIVAQHLQDSLDTLGNTPGKIKPVIVIMQPENPADDDTIIGSVAEQEYVAAAKKAGLQIAVVKIPGIVHANPGFRPGQWNDGYKNQVEPAIRALQTRQFVQNFLRTLEIVRHQVAVFLDARVAPTYMDGLLAGGPATPLPAPAQHGN